MPLSTSFEVSPYPFEKVKLEATRESGTQDWSRQGRACKAKKMLKGNAQREYGQNIVKSLIDRTWYKFTNNYMPAPSFLQMIPAQRYIW
jgi:hypothetical protein